MLRFIIVVLILSSLFRRPPMGWHHRPPMGPHGMGGFHGMGGWFRGGPHGRF